LRDQLEAAGIAVRASSVQGLSEEAPFAYKDVDEVVTTCERAGLARRVGLGMMINFSPPNIESSEVGERLDGTLLK